VRAGEGKTIIKGRGVENDRERRKGKWEGGGGEEKEGG